MRDDAVLRRALPLGRGLGRLFPWICKSQNIILYVKIFVFKSDTHCKYWYANWHGMLIRSLDVKRSQNSAIVENLTSLGNESHKV